MSKQNNSTTLLTEEDKNADSLQKQAISKGINAGILCNQIDDENATNLPFPIAVARCDNTEISIKRTAASTKEYLMVLPGQLALLHPGICGTLENIGSNTPVIDIDFEDTTLRLYGSIVYPSNTYLFMKFFKKGTEVQCLKSYDYILVFHSYELFDTNMKPIGNKTVFDDFEGQDIDWNDPPILGLKYSMNALKSENKDTSTTTTVSVSVSTSDVVDMVSSDNESEGSNPRKRAKSSRRASIKTYIEESGSSNDDDDDFLSE